jgi:hypothetical protein
MSPRGTLTHRLQSLCCVPLGSVDCASGKNIGCAYRKARVRFACCARDVDEWLCSLPGRSCCRCLAVSPCASSAAAAAALERRRWGV